MTNTDNGRVRPITILILAASMCALTSCSRSRSERRALNDAAEQYVRLALALGERDPDSLDVYSGPSEWKEEARRAYRPIGEIRADAERLRASVKSDESDAFSARRRFLDDQLGSLVARIDLLKGARPAFDDESRELFGIVPPKPDRARLPAIHSELDHILPGRGSLADRYRELEARFIVAPDRVSQVFSAALAVCRDRTRHHITLPSDEHVDVAIVPSRSPWAAFTQYLGDHRSRIRINGAFVFTVDRLLQLACHEAYPGHHTAYVLRDDELVRGQHRIEFFVEPQFSPDSYTAEGAATFAPDLVFDAADRARVDGTLLPGVASVRAAAVETGTVSTASIKQDLATYVRATALVDELGPFELDIARDYLDGRLEFARAAAAFTDDAVMADPMPVLKFLNEFRTYVVTYTQGRDDAARAIARAGTDEAARWRAYRALLTVER